jgi:BON domain-containing protein
MNPNQIVQRGGGIARGGLRIGERIVRSVGSEAWGVLQDARNLGRTPKPDMDDVTLARKVETEIFRGRGAPKSTVDVNVVDGVVWLRGEVKRPEQVRRLEQKARSVPEVRGVENLLHLVKTPAPTRADTPKRQQRTRSSTKRPAPRQRAAGRVSDDRTDAIVPQAEPSPAEHASEGEGRTPAPLGSTDTSAQAPAGSPQAPAGSDQPSAGSASARSEQPPAGNGSQEPGAGNGSREGQEEVPSAAVPAPREGGI